MPAVQAQHWQRLAVLSDSQQAALDQIAEHCGERAGPPQVSAVLLCVCLYQPRLANERDPIMPCAKLPLDFRREDDVARVLV